MGHGWPPGPSAQPHYRTNADRALRYLTIDGNTMLSCATDDVTSESFLNTSETLSAQEKLSEKLSFYVQWHMTTPDSTHSFRTRQVFEGGLILLVNNNLQLDAESGVGLNEATPYYFVGTGLSFRH